MDLTCLTSKISPGNSPHETPHRDWDSLGSGRVSFPPISPHSPNQRGEARLFGLVIWAGILALIILVAPQPAQAKHKQISVPAAQYERLVKHKKQSHKRIKILNTRVKRWRVAAQSRGLAMRSLVPWVNLRHCETKGKPDAVAWSWKGEFHGALQFHPGTWRSYGGGVFAQHAYNATPIQQVAIAQKVLASQGRSAWPSCSQQGAW